MILLLGLDEAIRWDTAQFHMWPQAAASTGIHYTLGKASKAAAS